MGDADEEEEEEEEVGVGIEGAWSSKEPAAIAFAINATSAGFAQRLHAGVEAAIMAHKAAHTQANMPEK